MDKAEVQARAKDVLENARKLIEKPSCWATGHFALDARGVPIQPQSPMACRFCALGAVDCIIRRTVPMGQAYRVREEAVLALHHTIVKPPLNVYYTITSANDKGGHAVVLKMFDDAIAKLKEDLA